MSGFWGVLVFLLALAILFKLFRKMAIGFLLLLIVEVLVIIVFPKTLVLLAQLVVKVHGLIG